VFRITEVIDGAARSRDQELQLGVIKLGKLASCHLRLEDAEVSRMHAVIEVTDAGITIIDLGSHQGTVVNGQRYNKAHLWHGDIIQLCSTTIELRFPDAPFTPYDPIDATERTLLDAIRVRPDDVATREVYADWLEQGGRIAHAAHLRFELDPARGAVLGDPAAAGWRAIVSRGTIANCWRAQCSKRWDRLALTGADDVRSCSNCSSKVWFCVSQPHADHCQRMKKPAVVDPALADNL
jgi:uncharacterized protein (TIGR02996 family)